MKTFARCLFSLLALTVPLLSHAQVEKFQGTWAPSQPGGEFVRAVIKGQNVQLFSACSPDPCNWGEDAAQPYWSSSKSPAASSASALVVTHDTVTDHLIVVITPVGRDLRFDFYARFAEGDKRRPYYRSTLYHAVSGKAAPKSSGAQ